MLCQRCGREFEGTGHLCPNFGPSMHVETWPEFLRRIASKYWMQEQDHDKLLKLADAVEFRTLDRDLLDV